MINEVTITVEFTTGTTIQDKKQAAKFCKGLLLDKLRELREKGIINAEGAQELDSGLFVAYVVKTEVNEVC